MHLCLVLVVPVVVVVCLVVLVSEVPVSQLSIAALHCLAMCPGCPHLLIVLAFSSFVVGVAIVVPVAAIAFAFVVLSFAPVFAFLSFAFVYHVAPMSIGAGPWLLLLDVIACSLVNDAVAL